MQAEGVTHRPETPEQRYQHLVEAFADEPGVTPPSDTPGREGKFGASALKVNGKIFAMLVRGRLVVKLPRTKVDELVASGDGEPFDAGKGRVMREWLSLAPESRLDWRALTHAAMEFVAAGH